MSDWIIKTEVMPHASGAGYKADEKAVGGKTHKLLVKASNFEDAYELAKAYVDGIETNPMVWKAFIVAIIQRGCEEPQ